MSSSHSPPIWQERYDQLWNLVPFGILRFGLDLRILEANRYIEELIGASREAMRTINLGQLRDQRIVPLFRSAIEGKSGSYQGPYETTIGDRGMYLSVRVEPTYAKDGVIDGGLAFVENVTERVTTENALRASQSRLALHMTQSPLGVIGWNLAFEIVEWNASATRIFGHSAQEAIGRDGQLLLRPEDHGSIGQLWSNLVAQRGGTRNTNFNVTKGGRTITCEWYNTVLVDAEGRALGVQSLVADVTERATAEKALMRSEARFRGVIERFPYAVGVTVDGRCAYVNPAAVHLYGCENEDELLGRPVTELLHPDDTARAVVRLQEMASGSARLSPELLRFVRRDGSLIDAEVVAMAVEFGERTAVLNVITDVTEKRTIQAKLMQTDRMAAMGMLAAGLAHEVNNPLAYVIANLDLLANRKMPAFEYALASEDRTSLDACRDALGDCNRMIEMAREGAARVRDIVRDLRSFTRSDDRRVPVDLARVLRACINLAHDEIASRATVQIVLPTETPFALASESRLGQVFLNLILNAVQALPAGRHGNRIVVSGHATDDDGTVVVRVEDNGTGISADVLPRIFEPFFTTKPPGVGTGLGLWICRSIVKQMGGDITVESGPGRTCFSVTIPAYAGASSSVRSPASAEPTVPTALRVLVVDDEPGILRVIGDALAGDFALTLAGSGFEAIERLQRGSDYDAILCDRVMPDLSGDDVFDWIRGHREDLVRRFAFMTGGEREHGALVGVSVIDKPFDLSSLRDVIDALANRGA